MAAEENKKEWQSFKLFADMLPQFEEMTDAEAGRVIKAIFNYAVNGRDTDFSGEDRLIKSFWRSTREKLDRQAEDMRKRSETNRNNARQRYRKDREPEEEDSS